MKIIYINDDYDNTENNFRIDKSRRLDANRFRIVLKDLSKWVAVFHMTVIIIILKFYSVL